VRLQINDDSLVAHNLHLKSELLSNRNLVSFEGSAECTKRAAVGFEVCSIVTKLCNEVRMDLEEKQTDFDYQPFLYGRSF
jgi:hypothetical protein